MNTSPDLDHLFTLTQQLPVEMDIAHVERIVIDFSPPRTGFPRWPFTVGILVAATILLLLPDQRTPPRLAAAFPVVAPAPAASPLVATLATQPLRVPARALALPVPTARVREIPVAERSLPVPVPRPYPAPAAAPPALPVSDLVPPQAPVYGTATVTGNWSFIETANQLHLTLQERVNRRKVDWIMTLQLTDTEVRNFFHHYEAEDVLERETGRLRLRKSFARLRGIFSFQPRLDVQDRYEAKGWGTEGVATEKVRLPQIDASISPKRKVFTNRPAAMLWWRYFLLDVDSEYFVLLDSLGIDATERNELWQLANYGITKKVLTILHQRLTNVLATGEIDLLLKDIIRFRKDERLFLALREQGYENLRLAELKALSGQQFAYRYVEEVNRYRQHKFTVEEILVLRRNIVNFLSLHHWQRAVTNDLTVEEIQQLQRAGVTSFDAIRFTPPNGAPITAGELIQAKRDNIGRLRGDTLHVGPDFGRRRTGFKAEVRALDDFCRLVVKDEIRVVIVPGTENKAEFVVRNNTALDIILKERKGCELVIHKKERWGQKLQNEVLAEIRLTAKRLRELEIKGPARVWMVGNAFDLCEHCDQPGRAVLDE